MARNTTELKQPTILENTAPKIEPKDITVPKRYVAPVNEAARIMKENIIQDKDGRGMFMDTEKVFDALCLSNEDAVEYLGGYDPNAYFKGGKLHQAFKKFFGRRLEEDTEEFYLMESVLSPYHGCLLFKQDRQNIYTILVPKMFSEHELDFNGEFSPDGVYYDSRVIIFSGFNSPTAFEADFFKKKVEQIKQSIQKTVNKRG